MTMQRIVAVDDEESILKVLRHTLERAGFEVHTCADAASTAPLVSEVRPDLLILDLMLPDGSGLDLTRDIRRTSDVPIIILSARGDEVDRILGLELGADDYMTKPFSPRELVVRVRAILRRGSREVAEMPERLSAGEVTVDLESHQVYVRDKLVPLTASEYRILQLLAASPDRAFSRAEILSALHDESGGGDERAIDAHIHHMREKLEDDPKNPAHLMTVRGFGYRLRVG